MSSPLPSSSRRFSLRGALLSLALLGGIAVGATEPLRQYTHTVGLHSHGFEGMNSNDAKAAFRVLNRELGRRYGYDLTSEVSVYDSNESFADAVNSGRVSTLLVSTWGLLQMGGEQTTDIRFGAVVGGRASHRWLLLVRRDSPYAVPGDLADCKVAMLQNSMSNLGDPWLETTLLEAGLPEPARFFARYEYTLKPSTAILPVFFHKLDACIVTEEAFRLMVELNPEIERKLHAIAQSETLLDSVICFNHRGWERGDIRGDLQRALGELDREAYGRQLLSLFKCERLEPFSPEQLDNVRRLYLRHRELSSTQRP